MHWSFHIRWIAEQAEDEALHQETCGVGLPTAAAGAPCDHGAGGGCDPSPPGVTTAKLLVASKVCVNPQSWRRTR